VHVERLQQIFEMMGKSAQSKTCVAIKGILKEGGGVAEEYADNEALSVGLLAGGQAFKREMSCYGAPKRGRRSSV
jgi:ferritin-like metal-binding protein YciE